MPSLLENIELFLKKAKKRTWDFLFWKTVAMFSEVEIRTDIFVGPKILKIGRTIRTI